ncbi:hypothetical protein NY78_0432 [Desulfovibrio sp. TomC]|nr:hypothetical protein NY78_0432 [Desulfovibrio sp. TomC]
MGMGMPGVSEKNGSLPASVLIPTPGKKAKAGVAHGQAGREIA